MDSEHLSAGALVAVYDLGGGTFDAAVVEATETGFRLAGPPGGDERAGGDAFDEHLLAHVGRKVAAVDPEGWKALVYSGEPRWRRAYSQLRERVRTAKESLSTEAEATVAVPGVERDVLVTRAEFEGLIAADVARTLDELDDVIAAAGATPVALAAVYPVGGSTRIPLVVRELRARHGDRVVTPEDPRAAMAVGAARLAAAPQVRAPASPRAAPAKPEPETARPAPAPRGRRLVAAGLVALALIALVVVSGVLRDDPEQTPRPVREAAAAPATSLDYTCPDADPDDLRRTVERLCLDSWFTAFAELPALGDARSAAAQFLAQFDEAFGTRLLSGCSDPAPPACVAEDPRIDVPNRYYTVMASRSADLWMLVREDGGGFAVADVSLRDPGDPSSPDPWFRGDLPITADERAELELGVECTRKYQRPGRAADPRRLRETVDGACVGEWFAEYLRSVRPIEGPEGSGVLEFTAYFDAAFGTNLHTTRDCRGRPFLGCVVRGPSAGTGPRSRRVWIAHDTGMGLLVEDGFRVLDLAIGDADRGFAGLPRPWRVGDGLAGGRGR